VSAGWLRKRGFGSASCLLGAVRAAEVGRRSSRRSASPTCSRRPSAAGVLPQRLLRVVRTFSSNACERALEGGDLPGRREHEYERRPRRGDASTMRRVAERGECAVVLVSLRPAPVGRKIGSRGSRAVRSWRARCGDPAGCITTVAHSINLACPPGLGSLRGRLRGRRAERAHRVDQDRAVRRLRRVHRVDAARRPRGGDLSHNAGKTR